ncbi:MAG: cytochrome c biogenesis protein CcsA [Spirochaetes bacterium]|nr:cytochrome c biogenesis protein CcsA [Spirochaetota bacterium]
MRLKIALLLAALLGLLPAADGKFQVGKSFERLLILEQGRLKPMDSYARKFLLGISSRSRAQGLSASAWFARLLFEPVKASEDAVFRVYNEETITAMGLQLPESRRYSFRQLEPGMEKLLELARAADAKPEATRSLVEKEVIGLYMSLSTFQNLANSLAFADTGRHIEIAEEKNRRLFDLKPGESLTLPGFLARRREIAAKLPAADMHGGHGGTPDVAELFRIMYWVESLKAVPGLPNLDILPDYRDGSERWYAPWVYLTEIDDKSHDDTIAALQKATAAYKAGDSAAFEQAFADFDQRALARIPARFAAPRPALEVFYNKLDGFYKAEILYGLSFVLILLFLLFNAGRLRQAAGISLALGAAFNLAAIAIRTFLTGRAPVTNLFETFVFVGLTASVLGLILERFNRRGIGTLTGSLGAIGMLLISGAYSSDGDTMGPMVAVLRSNFWLATHVLTITIGYAGVVVAGIIAHVHLIQAMRRKTEPAALENTMRMLYGALAVGFLFTFVGTVLGGVWADQSWGRFWGWDPKENGALAIVLWTSILLHARLTKLVDGHLFAAGTALGTVFVMLAWFGVNLLGVGLHSYGFTTGIATGLFAFTFLEVAFAAFALWWLKVRAPRAVAGN